MAEWGSRVPGVKKKKRSRGGDRMAERGSRVAERRRRVAERGSCVAERGSRVAGVKKKR